MIGLFAKLKGEAAPKPAQAPHGFEGKACLAQDRSYHTMTLCKWVGIVKQKRGVSHPVTEH